MNPQHIPSLLTTEQAAVFLSVSPHTLAVWRSTGRYNLPYAKIGNRVRYELVDLQAYINKRKRGGQVDGE
jgi:predicted site-specific integrase-resolvase